MWTVRDRKIIKYDDKNPIMKYEFDIDSASDLESITFPKGEQVQGSIAHDISTGDFYSIDSAGTWYKQDGSGAYSSENNSKSINLNKSIVDIPVEDKQEIEPQEEVINDGEFIRDTEER